MTITIPNDTEQIQRWAFENGINFYSPELLEIIYDQGCETTDEKFPAEIELEVEIEAESYTHHPYGSTTATQTHHAEILEIKYNDKPVTEPRWLRDYIMRQI